MAEEDAAVSDREGSSRAPAVAGVAFGPTQAAMAVGAIVLVSLNLRMAVTSVPPILPDLGLSGAGESLLATLPVLLFGAAAAAGPALRARLGEEHGMFVALAVLLSGVLVRAVWPEALLFPGTVIACAGIAVLNVLVPSIVRRRFPERVGPMMGLYTMSLIGGATLAAGLTVPVRDATGGSNGVALGVWAIPLVFAMLAWVPLLQGADRNAGRFGETTVSVWRSPLAWQVTLFMGFQSLTYFGPLSWLPTIYREEGLSSAAAGGLLSVFNALGLVSSLAAPILAQRMRDQRGAVAASVALTASGILGLLIAPGSGALLWAVLLGLGQGAALSLAMLMIVMRAPDDDTAARLSSMAQGVGYLVAALGPVGMGLLHGLSGGWTVPLLALLAVAVAELAIGLAAARNRVVTAAARKPS